MDDIVTKFDDTDVCYNAPPSLIEVVRRRRAVDPDTPPPKNWFCYDRFGYPLRGVIPSRLPSIEEEPDVFKTIKVYKSKFFDLSVPEQLQDYNDVLTACVNNVYILFVHRPPEKLDNPIAYLEWAEVAVELTKKLE